ncbi:MAG: phosphocholine cytidylyltransferase family protein [Deltaproteobacteria bacterium]|nr:phosphocholine cytidylyltransferase family protein [Deltaproteobacteria bacterium]
MSFGKPHSAVFLAAGYGARISKLTQDPKSLLRICDQTLLERHFSFLKENNIQEVRIVTGYKSELIQAYLKKLESNFDITHIFCKQYRERGNAYSLYLGIRDVEDQNVLIFDTDLVYEKSILSNFIADNHENSVLGGACAIDDLEATKILVDQNNLVRQFVDKRAILKQELKYYRFSGEAMGILKFSSVSLSKLKKTCEQFFEEDNNLKCNWEPLLNLYLKEYPMNIHFNSSRLWVEIDTPEDFEKAKQLFSDCKR